MNDSAAGFASSLSASGYALLALAVLAYALYSVYVEKAVGYSGAEITFAMLAAGALVFGVNKTASFIGVSTVVSIAAGALLLGERLTAGQLAGAAMILAGVYIANAGTVAARNG